MLCEGSLHSSSFEPWAAAAQCDRQVQSAQDCQATSHSEQALPLLQVTARTGALHDLEERSKALAALQAELSAERARLAEARTSLEGELAKQAQLASQVAADKASLERSRLSVVEREAELRRKQLETAEAIKVGPV